MPLRGKKPQDMTKRLKLLMFGPAGVGKTVAAIQMPHPYLIDTEGGAQHYGKLIDESKGAVFASNDFDEVKTEILTLMTEQHDYQTLVIDSITPVYDALLEKAEREVGQEYGRHYGLANKSFKRLMALLFRIDMNVIVTAHGKNVYGDGLKVLGQTFDGYKKLDYLFDLVLELQKRGKERWAVVSKSRLSEAGFPDGDEFEFNYGAIRDRYNAQELERTARVETLATTEQVQQAQRLIEVLNIPTQTTDKWLDKAGAGNLSEMPADALGKCIDWMRNKIDNQKEQQ